MKRYRTILAIASPFIACAIQWLFWQSIQPLVWFLFYPAVFISAWIGGFWTGLVSTFIATTLAFLFFINPNYPISMIHTKTFITLSVFLTMGTLFSVLLGRLKKLNEQLSSDLRQNEISQKEEEKSLEIKYRSIMESVTDYIVVLDKDQRIQYNNHVAAGLEWEDVKGTDWLLWLEDKDRNIASDAFQLARNTGKPTECEFRAIEAYGKMTSFNAKFAPILGSSEDIVLLATNITDRKNKEHELNAELEQRVINRTKQLEEANKELEAFSYSVSHDLRSPLRAINGYTNILLEDYFPILDEEGKRVCNVISGEAARMGKLIDDLLSFSRSSRMDMQISLINMKAMAQRVFDELIQMEKTRKIEFNLSDIPSIQGDSVLIRQVWMNLISNAIKFTSKKEKAIIEISAKELDSEIVYSVTDNGAGFDMKYADKLFGVFQRLHKESEFEGTGVGLAIIKRAVMRNGGRVRAKGEIDKGATLYFALPKKNVKWEI